jgi:hypothetical protein
MTEPQGDREAVEAAKGLTVALGVMAGELKAVNERQDVAENFGRKSRFMILATFASIALDVALTLALVFVYGSARNSAVEASAARAVSAAQHSNLIAACRLSNESRAASIQLWQHLVSVSHPAPHSTRTQLAARQRKLAALIIYVKHVYAPRDCISLYRIPAAPPRR